MTDMSMISALIDELNKSADEWNNSNMFELARMCREAADTIWQLRDDLQRTNAENAKLRELCSKLAQVVANDDVTFRKLREIAKRELGYDFIGAYDSSLGDMDQLPLFSDRMRELGVEVDDDREA